MFSYKWTKPHVFPTYIYIFNSVHISRSHNRILQLYNKTPNIPPFDFFQDKEISHLKPGAERAENYHNVSYRESKNLSSRHIKSNMIVIIARILSLVSILKITSIYYSGILSKYEIIKYNMWADSANNANSGNSGNSRNTSLFRFNKIKKNKKSKNVTLK